MNRPNLTVAAVVHYQGKFLVVEETDKTTQKIVYNQPAGHVEADENLIQASVRELNEETGVFLQPDALLGLYQFTSPHNGKTYIRVCFIYEPEYMPSSLGPRDEDIIASHWLTLDELVTRDLRSPLVMRCIDDYLSGKRHSLDFICTI